MLHSLLLLNLLDWASTRVNLLNSYSYGTEEAQAFGPQEKAECTSSCQTEPEMKAYMLPVSLDCWCQIVSCQHAWH